MRTDIKMLCVTNWNAVLELVESPFYFMYPKSKAVKYFHKTIRVADPDAIDAGMIITIHEIKLVIRLKAWKAMPYDIIQKHLGK